MIRIMVTMKMIKMIIFTKWYNDDNMVMIFIIPS